MAKDCIYIRGSRLSRVRKEERLEWRRRRGAREGGGRRAKSRGGRERALRGLVCGVVSRTSQPLLYTRAHRIARRHIGRYRSRACTLLLAGGYRLPVGTGKRGRGRARERRPDRKRGRTARARGKEMTAPAALMHH